MFWWTVLYIGAVNYSGTAIINVYVIVYEFAIHIAFYDVILYELGTNGTEYELRTWNVKGKSV